LRCALSGAEQVNYAWAEEEEAMFGPSSIRIFTKLLPANDDPAPNW
jgi:hypothetical protein